MQITSAMKMVSAAKLKRAQDAITQMRPYSEKLQNILGNLTDSLDLSEGTFVAEREVKNVMIVAVSSNRGLCGGFNNNIIKHVNHLANNDYKGLNTSLLTIGKKVKDSFRSSPLRIKGSDFPKNCEEIYNDLSFDAIVPIAESLMNAFAQGRLDKVVIVYNKFKNAATQIVTTEQFLPLLPNVVEEGEASNDYIFEPSKTEIVEELIPKSLKVQLYKAILDSYASEHGARMTAMHKATDNATEMQKGLKLSYNKARQAAITNEILEIVGGAEALNN
jgi:F-type H+-transporting ATPase subunit gamma